MRFCSICGSGVLPQSIWEKCKYWLQSDVHFMFAVFGVHKQEGNIGQIACRPSMLHPTKSSLPHTFLSPTI